MGSTVESVEPLCQFNSEKNVEFVIMCLLHVIAFSLAFSSVTEIDGSQCTIV